MSFLKSDELKYDVWVNSNAAMASEKFGTTAVLLASIAA